MKIFNILSTNHLNLKIHKCALTIPVPISDEEKKWNEIYFRICLRCFKRFKKGLKSLKTFWGTTKKYENWTLISLIFEYNFLKCKGQEWLSIRFLGNNYVDRLNIRKKSARNQLRKRTSFDKNYLVKQSNTRCINY